MTAPHLAMILANPMHNDPRVDKEARDLVAQGYEVTVLAWDRGASLAPEEHRHGFRILRLPVASTFGRGAAQVPALLRFYRAAWPRILRGGFAALHCHDLETLPLGIAAARRLRLPLVFDAHEPSYYADARRWRPLLRAAALALEWTLVRRADVVLVTNDYQLQRCRRLGARRACLVANWPERWLLDAPSPAPRPRPLGIGRIGALDHDMGIEELVQAHRILRQEFPGLRLVLAGQVTPGYAAPLDAALRDADGLVFRGAYSYAELPRLYADLDVAVLPQRRTPWFEHITPTKLFEAMARGVPVVTTDIGGVGALLGDYACGAVLERVTPAEIVRRVRPFLADAGRRRAAGEAGRRLIERQLNWDASRSALLGAYACLRGAAAGPARAGEFAVAPGPREKEAVS